MGSIKQGELLDQVVKFTQAGQAEFEVAAPAGADRPFLRLRHEDL